jgi:4-amino-4-deoxy-L-arabinose transferase-like glycosyltransferase
MGDPQAKTAGGWSGLFLCLVLCLASLLPFLNKAYHIDDPLFLWVAEQIKRDPGDFFRFNVNWETRPKPMWEETRNPPLASYYIALVARLFDISEPVLHAAFLLPAVLAIWGTYRLAEEFCRQPVLATLVALWTPAFLVSSTNLMCDTMMLVFWMWAVLAWERALRSRRACLFAVSGVLIGLSAWTKYFGISLVPLLLVYTLALRRRAGWWLVALAIPLVMLGAYQALTYRLYGQNLLWEAMTFSREIQEKSASKIGWRDKLIEGLSFTGGCVAPVLFLAPVLFSGRSLMAALTAMVIVGWGIYLGGMIGPFKVVLDDGAVRWWVIVEVLIWSATGIGLLILTALDFWANRDSTSVLLFMWVAGTFVFAGFVNWAINARSVLPLAPAAGILVARRLSQTGPAPWGRTVWSIGAAAVLALGLAWADYRFANSMREGAEAMMKIANASKESGRTVWFEGHWGFQYYMEKAGARIIDLEKVRCEVGDLLVMPTSNNYGLYMMPEGSAKTEKTVEVPASHGLAPMHFLMGAGFYANRIGPLPFAFGHVTPETYELYRIVRRVHGALEVLKWSGHDFIRPPNPIGDENPGK